MKIDAAAVSSALLLATLSSLLAGSAAANGVAPSERNHYMADPDRMWGTDYSLLDTSRAARVIEPAPPRTEAGWEYRDDVGMYVEATVGDDVLGPLGMSAFFPNGYVTYFDMHMRQTSVTRTGKKSVRDVEIDSTIERIDVDLSAPMVVDLRCHYELDAKTGAVRQDVNDPDCSELGVLVGETETIEVDPKTGEVVRVVTYDGHELTAAELEKLQATLANRSNSGGTAESSYQQSGSQSTSLVGKFQAQQWTASHHHDKKADLVKWLPEHAVAPGDEWPDRIDMSETIGCVFEGTSVLRGYTSDCAPLDPDSSGAADCAVFTMDGTVKVDQEAFRAMMAGISGGGNGLFDDDFYYDDAVDDEDDDTVTITDAAVKTTFVWDTQTDRVAFFQADVKLDLLITVDQDELTGGPGMFGGYSSNKKVTLDVPMDVMFDFQSLARKTVDDDDMDDDGWKVRDPTEMEKEAEKTEIALEKGGGFFGKFLLFLLLAGAAFAGFVVYRRRTFENGHPYLKSRPGMYDEVGANDLALQEYSAPESMMT